jgi:EpsI family protein
MKATTRRSILALGILGAGLATHTALEAGYRTPRPELRAPLASLPTRLGKWVGRDEPMDPEILERTQADDHLNRVYEDSTRPGRAIKVWINYSRHGLNLRHSPEVCLPSGGWTKVESQTRVLRVACPSGEQPITRLTYGQADVTQGIGFWYYIFGEGPLERLGRTLPISSRSSHGRTTRGSGLTVELFYPGDFDPEGQALSGFTAELLAALEPILPRDRVAYHVP